jgi:hypothetical protein
MTPESESNGVRIMPAKDVGRGSGEVRGRAILSVAVAAVLAPLLLAGCGEDDPQKRTFVAACEPELPKMDCGCFYDEAGEILDEKNTTALLGFMKNKQGLSAKKRKQRLTALVGASKVTPVWRASMICARL